MLALRPAVTRAFVDGKPSFLIALILLPQQNNEYIQSVARCLQMMLRINEYRLEFVRLDGIGAIVSVLSGRINFQIQYQARKTFWTL